MALRTCQRYGCAPDDARRLLGLRPLSPRRLGAWTAALTEIGTLEEAYDECTRKEGKPTIEQRLAVRAVEVEYIRREDIDIIADESEPVLTPTDIAALEAARADRGAILAP